jgi:hypothetical protein
MYLFTGFILTAIVISTQIAPHGLGRFFGVMESTTNKIEQIFPKIKIASKTKIYNDYIHWIENDGLYESEDDIFLILDTDSGIFIK